MLTGMQLFDEVDDRLARAQQEAAAAQAEAEALAHRRDAARAAEAEALRALARLRLRALAAGDDALGQLDAAEAQVRALLAERGGPLAAAEAELARRRQALDAARAERDRHAEALRAAEARDAEAMTAARARIEADPEWQRLDAAAEKAARIATHAAQKATLAGEDLEAKGRPYLEDALFAYLWDRGFGTGRYRAGPITRMLDRWTARVARFDAARRDYAMLSDLPGRLAGHAERMAAEAAAAEAALDAAERRLAGLPAEGGATTAARDALEQAEDALEAAAGALIEAERARSGLAGGEDPAMQEAATSLEAALGAASLRSLREAARRTPTPEDDVIVARLEAAAAERAAVERELGAARTEAETARRQLDEVQSLRGEMRRRGYGRDAWDFKDGAAVGVLLGEVLRGGMSRDRLWDRMGGHRMQGGWRFGGSVSGGNRARGSWSASSDHGDFGGGGFRTGGSMGGGGFKTGGGF